MKLGRHKKRPCGAKKRRNTRLADRTRGVGLRFFQRSNMSQLKSLSEESTLTTSRVGADMVVIVSATITILRRIERMAAAGEKRFTLCVLNRCASCRRASVIGWKTRDGIKDVSHIVCYCERRDIGLKPSGCTTCLARSTIASQQCCVGWRVRFAHGCAAAENKIPRFADGSLDSDACCGQCRCWLPIDLVVYKRKRRQQRQRSQVGCGSRTRTVFRADLCSTRRPCHARAEDLAVTCMVSAGDDLCFAEVAWFDCRPNRPPRAFF